MASGGSNLEKKVENLSINEKTDINILLLGETGVGKSTFINSVANYLIFGDLREAENKNVIVLIPTMFSSRDKNGVIHNLEIGEKDVNEVLNNGVSGTQKVKTYVFPIWDGRARVRLIDTPGMGDTRGIQQDHINSENILAYISQLHELHAICFLFKPNQSRNTVLFKYCMAQILSRLDKSASKNIIFAFTNTRGSDYGPGDTINLLKKEIDAIRSRPPHAEIPIEKNIFCFDNEVFRYLAAVEKGVEYSGSIKDHNEESWNISVEQCWKMINYIVGDANHSPLKPHYVKSTSAINEARRLIYQLAQPLAEISQLISHNMLVLARHEENLKMDHASLDELKTKLYMPAIELEVVKMEQPATVCTTMKCAEVYQVSERNVWHYKQRCHEPCHLRNVTREIIGAPELVNCDAMAGTNDCVVCGCSFRVHQHIYYMTKVKESQEVDPTVKKNINDKKKIVENAKKIMKGIINKKEELDNEHRIIVTTCARFAHFLHNNAITPFNDSYKEYIEYLINREQSMGKFCVKETVEHLQRLYREYEETKKSFDEALNLNQKLGRTVNEVSPKEISDSIQDLYKLKHNGKKIKELYECQEKSRAKEHEHSEYIHKTTNWAPKHYRRTNRVVDSNIRQVGGNEFGFQYRGPYNSYANQQPKNQPPYGGPQGAYQLWRRFSSMFHYPPPAPGAYGVNAFESEPKQDEGKIDGRNRRQGGRNENGSQYRGPDNRYDNQRADPNFPSPFYHLEGDNQSSFGGPPQGAYQPYRGYYPPPALDAYYDREPQGAYPPLEDYYYSLHAADAYHGGLSNGAHPPYGDYHLPGLMGRTLTSRNRK